MTTELEPPCEGQTGAQLANAAPAESEELGRLRRKIRLLEVQNELLSKELEARDREASLKPPKEREPALQWRERLSALEEALNGDHYRDGLERRFFKRVEDVSHAQQGTTNTVAMLQTRIEEVYQLCREEIAAIRAQVVQGGPSKG